MRWWASRASAVAVFAALLLTVALLAAVLTFLSEVSRSSESAAADEYSTGPHRRLRVWLACARALFGVDSFPRQNGNTVHEVLATFASAVGATVPAIVVGLVAVRLFSARFFVWRDKMNLSTFLELRSDTSADLDNDLHGLLSVRLYKRIDKVALSEIRVQAYLGYRTRSLVDGSEFFQRERLNVLSVDAREVDERIWPRLETAMPLTLWIPTKSEVVDGAVSSIQGRPLLAGRTYRIFVTVQAQISGLGLEVYDQRRYVLPDSLQSGRAVPIEPALGENPTSDRAWRGWGRFDEAATYGVFVYGSLMDPELIPTALGTDGSPSTSDWCRARLSGFTRTWSVCTDNTRTTTVRYFESGTHNRPQVQVLFLNVEESSPTDTVEGIIVPVEGRQLLHLDKREGNYVRRVVTGAVEATGGSAVPDVVWVYVGKSDRVSRAKRAIAEGTACIRRQYLEAVRRAFSAHAGLGEGLAQSVASASVPVVDLDRVAEDQTT